ncbi:glycoside hydrolase family 130 protein [Alkalitalea saponilacus]|uniref:4-O-beta-D-mannosyl-D-glucose phosphorylase n=1 Tax=Alkalitalea saponilacus TaxID=889453 RepID=A0A1T5HTG3_9BACT|nr:glycosidase [Alkalitalea saponilacus]ASB48953.1 glycosidase [Alkalitalea saponilacus]SKC23902.1 4-O-beta-D-mannosyl-D-glucose phosphorylase [Alkalitalea saponilacus]
MQKDLFSSRYNRVKTEHEALLSKPNEALFSSNGIYSRYKNPILTRNHVPLHWRFDLNPETNPCFMERIGFNATFNSGAIKWGDKYLLAVRVEGNDRKSFFAIAESPNGVDNFRFWNRPITLPETEEPDTNVYDMRLTRHDDGYVYGIFCTERKDPEAPPGDTSSAVAAAGIARTMDLVKWERLPDLISTTGQQRNVVLFPHFIEGKYAFYTRPQDGFIDTGKGGGIGFGFSESIENAEIKEEVIVDAKTYHTIYEVKNGLGPAPIRTEKGWLQMAHGVRNTAAGLRYTIYMFMTDMEKPWLVTHKPNGHFISPLKEERVGDVSNVVFNNGWIADEDGKVYIYYASSDTRMHVAVSTIDQLVDYCINSPQDQLRSAASVQTINNLIDKNLKFM